MISFMLCYVSWTSLIQFKIYINSTYEYQINEEAFHSKQYVMHTKNTLELYLDAEKRRERKRKYIYIYIYIYMIPIYKF